MSVCVPVVRFDRQSVRRSYLLSLPILVASTLNACTRADSATNIDISGVSLQMPYEEAESVFTKHALTVPFRGASNELYYAMRDENDAEFRAIGITGKVANFQHLAEPTRNQDILIAFYTPPANGHQVAGLYRSMGFAEGEAPDLQEIRNLLSEKYGAPVQEIIDGPYISWVWQEISDDDWADCALESGVNTSLGELSMLIEMSTNMIGSAHNPKDVADVAYGNLMGGEDLGSECGQFLDASVKIRSDGTVESVALQAIDYHALAEARSSVERVREQHQSTLETQGRPTF